MFPPPAGQASRLLVPLDGSRLAEAALPLVTALAGSLSCRVTLLHILEQRAPASIHGERHLREEAESRAYLADVAACLTAGGVAIDGHVHASREGDVAGSIVDHAAEMEADLVVLCTHGSVGWRGLVHGRAAEQVLRRGRQPVLLVPAEETDVARPVALRRILVPLDGTAAHEPALPTAIALARTFGAELRLLLVIPTVGTLSPERGATGRLLPTTMKAVLDLAVEGGGRYLDQVLDQCRSAGVTATAKVSRGAAARAVCRQAERESADLVVMASHGHAGIEALFEGSVTSRVANRVPCPLLLLHAAPEESPTRGEEHG